MYSLSAPEYFVPDGQTTVRLEIISYTNDGTNSRMLYTILYTSAVVNNFQRSVARWCFCVLAWDAPAPPDGAFCAAVTCG